MRSKNVRLAKLSASLLFAATLMLAVLISVFRGGADISAFAVATPTTENLVDTDQLVKDWEAMGFTFDAETGELKANGGAAVSWHKPEVPVKFGQYEYYKNTATGEYVPMRSIPYKVSYTYQYGAASEVADNSGLAGYVWCMDTKNFNGGFWMVGNSTTGRIYCNGTKAEMNFPQGASKDAWLTVDIEVYPDYENKTTLMKVTVAGETLEYTYHETLEEDYKGLGTPKISFDTEQHGMNFKDISMFLLAENIDVNDGVNELPVEETIAGNLVDTNQLVKEWKAIGFTFDYETRELKANGGSAVSWHKPEVPVKFGQHKYYKNTATGKYVPMQSIAYKVSYTYQYGAESSVPENASGLAGYAWCMDTKNFDCGFWMVGNSTTGKIYGGGSTAERTFTQGASKDAWLTVDIEVYPDYENKTTLMKVTVAGETLEYTYKESEDYKGLGMPKISFDTEQHGMNFKDISMLLLTENIDVNDGVDEAKFALTEAVDAFKETFVNDKGASIRKNAPSGMRFSVSGDLEKYNALLAVFQENGVTYEFGTVIVPESYVNEAREITPNAEGILTIKAENGWNNTETAVNYKASIVDIKEYNYDLKFMGLGYFTYTYEGKTEVIWAKSGDNARSVYGVAVKAQSEGETSEFIEAIIQYVEENKTEVQ